ncbi:tetrapyrrole biosynthesis, uroporphyrinogen III synthase [Coemansia spiralis]|nr:tetrapyrrole biosynthesis, uroporphyrinogen III synthase [Coemansia spiralis]
MKTAVILLRDKTKGDSYTDLLLQDHCIVESVPVLEHRFLLTAQIVESILNDHSKRAFVALVFTSKNAARALSQAVDLWLAEHVSSEKEQAHQKWKQMLSLPIFVVGRETEAACRSYILNGIKESDIRCGDTGNAAAMLPQILEFCKSMQTSGRWPRILFFCGDQRRDTLPDGIRGSNAAELVETVAYTTVGRTNTETRSDLADAIDQIKSQCQPLPVLIWVVFFSPSGVRAVTPLLESLEHVDGLIVPVKANEKVASGDDSITDAGALYGVCAIGKTTMAEITSQGLGDRVMTAQADAPNAGGIRNALSLQKRQI